MGKLSMVETLTYKPNIVDKHKDGVDIGREVLPIVPYLVRWEPSRTVLELINALNPKYDPQAERNRHCTAFKMKENTPSEKWIRVRHDRPVSTYFSYDSNNKTMIIEWGTVNPIDRTARLHTYLNQHIDFQGRAKRGMQKLCSGHLASLVTANGEQVYIAIIDSLQKGSKIGWNTPLAKMINTMHAHGIIPITSDGFVQFPMF